jgi:hypothetical protein
MMKKFLKRKLYVGSVLMYVKKGIHSKWNAVVKVPSDLYMKTVQLSGLAPKETRTVMYVG